MKWILYYFIVTSYGATESQYDFDTYEECKQAAEIIHERYDGEAKIIRTSCEPETFYD